jgi:hypothetical protein
MASAYKRLWILGLLAVGGLLMGCSDEKPQGARPDPGNLSSDDSGLQSKDVLAASDQMATDLLTDPGLNNSRTQWTMTIGHFEDQTIDKSFATNYDIFLERLRTIISQKSGGRITLIENKDQFHQIRDSELEGSGDTFGQGPGANSQPAPAAINPDYIMYGKAMDMPNRSTIYYMLEFTVFNAQTRVQVWSRQYEVKVER